MPTIRAPTARMEDVMNQYQNAIGFAEQFFDYVSEGHRRNKGSFYINWKYEVKPMISEFYKLEFKNQLEEFAFADTIIASVQIQLASGYWPLEEYRSYNILEIASTVYFLQVKFNLKPQMVLV